MLEDLEVITEKAVIADTIMEAVIKDSTVIILADLLETAITTATLEEVPCAMEEEAVVIVTDPIKPRQYCQSEAFSNFSYYLCFSKVLCILAMPIEWSTFLQV
jgi:hypothetical protein